MKYIRTCDGASVTEAEALDASRTLKDGYRWDYIGFDVALMDSRPSGARHTFFDAQALTDAERQFVDSAEGREQIALARASFTLSQAHLGDVAREWTPADAAAAIRQPHNPASRSVADATLQAKSDAALNAIDPNAWRI